MITLIVAFDENRVMGRLDGTLPWYIKEDFQHFKQTTLNSSVLMGRKTWESLPRKPLPQRQNIVLTKTPIPEVETATTLQEAISKAKHKIYIIGGLKVYQSSLEGNLIDKLIVSHIKGTHEGELRFPEFNLHGKIIKEFEQFTVKEYYVREDY